jgi:hypothetical protein
MIAHNSVFVDLSYACMNGHTKPLQILYGNEADTTGCRVQQATLSMMQERTTDDIVDGAPRGREGARLLLGDRRWSLHHEANIGPGANEERKAAGCGTKQLVAFIETGGRLAHRDHYARAVAPRRFGWSRILTKHQEYVAEI